MDPFPYIGLIIGRSTTYWGATDTITTRDMSGLPCMTHVRIICLDYKFWPNQLTPCAQYCNLHGQFTWCFYTIWSPYWYMMEIIIAMNILCYVDVGRATLVHLHVHLYSLYFKTNGRSKQTIILGRYLFLMYIWTSYEEEIVVANNVALL